MHLYMMTSDEKSDAASAVMTKVVVVLVPPSLISGSEPVKVHDGANPYAISKVTVQVSAAEDPIVTFPAVSFPLTEGADPHELATGEVPPVTRCVSSVIVRAVTRAFWSKPVLPAGAVLRRMFPPAPVPVP